MSSTTAEQDAAGAADDDSVEAELFGEDDGGDDPSEDKAAVAAAAAPVAAPAAPADSKALSFSIPKIKKESAEGTAPATTTPTASNASAATTPTLASPPKHGHDDTSPRRKLSNGGGGGDSLQLPDELVLSVSAREVLATDRTNRLRTLLLKVCVPMLISYKTLMYEYSIASHCIVECLIILLQLHAPSHRLRATSSLSSQWQTPSRSTTRPSNRRSPYATTLVS
jgi:hypothetical protein